MNTQELEQLFADMIIKYQLTEAGQFMVLTFGNTS